MVVALALTAPTVAAQRGSVEAQLRAQREELNRIRRERDSLQARLRQLEGSARDFRAEAKNLEQQADATARAVSALDRQLRSMSAQLDTASGALTRAQDELLIKQATMRRRLIDIYKRGPLYSVEALLSAESFGELVARYKYLRTVAVRDRAIVHRTEELRASVAGQRDLLVELQTQLAGARAEKRDEEQRLRGLEDQWQRRVVTTERERDAITRRLQLRSADETRLTNTIAALDAERRRNDPRPSTTTAPAPGSLRAADAGKLDWPVDGDIIYSFGRIENPNNTTLRWTGIGIGAPAGTPVRAVAAGVVSLAETGMSTYGNIVILQHGGDYTLYASLGKITVGKGQFVEKGEQIGVVGTSDADLGPHLHFEVRTASPKGNPVAVDPLDWLRSRR